MKKPITLVCAALALAACSNTPAGQFFDREAGAAVDANANFGNATMNNTQIQTGQAGYTISLARRFAAEVDSTVNFAFNSTALDAQARNTLRTQAAWIQQFPEVRFTVYGHTDLVGGTAYNRQLGLRRAEAVVLYLVSQGVDRSRLDMVVSQGETQPLVVTEGRERRNRRTVTEVSGFVQSHPSVLNGKYAEVIFREYLVSAEPPQVVTETQGGQATGVE